MSTSIQKLGKAGEDLAAQFLVTTGYRILARNLETRYGEVDILASVGQTMIIVEVKTKTNLQYGQPVEMITPSKLSRLQRIATYLAQQKQCPDYRVDIVTILYIGSKPTIEHYIAIL